MLADVGRQTRTKAGKPLGHNTLERIKSFLSGAFKTAKRLGALDGVNPINDTSVPAGTPAGVTHAYSLAEVRSMLALLPEPAKTVVLFAAFTGMRQGEIRGALWKDFSGKTLAVERSIWNGIVNKPKTACSAAPIPVVRPLSDALGTPDREIQAILRHSNVAITQASYIKSVAESQQNALDLVAAEMASGESCNDPATEAKGPVN